MSEQRLKREDLDALGGMASLVGTYMQDFAKRADGSDRRTLFKGGIDAKTTVINATRTVPNDLAANSITAIANKLAEAAVPETSGASVQESADQLPPPRLLRLPLPPDAPTPPETSSPQMEFSFIKNEIRGYGSVSDVIKHFNERLDNLEESIKLIKSFVVDVRATMEDVKTNMPKRKYKVKNAPQKIT